MPKAPSDVTSRRAFIQSSSLSLAAGLAARSGAAPAAQSNATGSAPSRSPPASGRLFVDAETVYGKVQGLQVTGVKIFKGIPYGAPTGGRNRFMPPRKPAAWAGVRECLAHGPISPQAPTDLRSEYGMMIHWDFQPGGMSEDCLTLNVWTPGLNDGVKRPVLVSLHGGGFTTGSANALGYDGAQLARLGEVVVITVNHRLGSFGYLQLADLGAPKDFAFAGVAGIMDLAASLEWVRDNVENFGGDPHNVMIFGQSGGGAKTSTLLATPAAKGLFHRAAVQSGSLLKFAARERATQNAELLLKQLGIANSRITDLQKLPWQQLLEAQIAVSAGAPDLGGMPVLDGEYLPHDAFDPVAPAESAGVPLMVSTTLEDAALALSNFSVSDRELKTLLDRRYPAKGTDMIALYRQYYPEKSPYLLQAMMFTDAGFRRSALKQAELKCAQGQAPVYLYEWDWPSPAFGGRYGALHGLDVSAAFHEARDGNDMLRVSEQLSCAWVEFAKSGNPNTPRLPPWPTYDLQTRATMVFGTPTQLVNDHRGEIRQFWERMPASAGMLG